MGNKASRAKKEAKIRARYEQKQLAMINQIDELSKELKISFMKRIWKRIQYDIGFLLFLNLRVTSVPTIFVKILNQITDLSSKLRHYIEFYLLVPNVSRGCSIEYEPFFSENSFRTICPACENMTYTEGLDNYSACMHCSKKFKKQSGEIIMPKHGSKDITDFNLSEIKIKDIPFGRLPELESVVLSICYESVPSNLKFAGKIDFNQIKENILLPYFQKRMRVLREGNFFTADTIHFKIMSTNNKQCYGRVSTDTQIYCYKDMRLRRALAKIKLAPCQNSDITVGQIKEYVAAKNYLVHLERDQVLRIGDQSFKVIKSTPQSGLITTSTVIEVKSNVITPIQKITLVTQQSKLPFMFKKSQMDMEVFHQKLVSKLIKPYFTGINRFLKKKDELVLDETSFTVAQILPAEGIVTNETQITSMLVDSEAEYERLFPDQDGIIDCRVTNKENININTNQENKTNQRNSKKSLTVNPTIQSTNRRSSIANVEEEKGDIALPSRPRVMPLRENTNILNMQNNNSNNSNNINSNRLPSHRQSVQSLNNIDDPSPRLIGPSIQINKPPQKPCTINEIKKKKPSSINNLGLQQNLGSLEFQRHNSANNSSQMRGRLDTVVTNTLNTLPSVRDEPTAINLAIPNGSINIRRYNSSQQQEEQKIQQLPNRQRVNNYVNPQPLASNRTSSNTNNRPRSSSSNVRDIQNLTNQVRSRTPNTRDPNTTRQVQRKKKSNGAKQSQINMLPLRKIDIDFIKNKQLNSQDHVRCNICITDYEDQDTVRTLPCLHYFHSECIDSWLLRNKTCPLCKTPIDI